MLVAQYDQQPFDVTAISAPDGSITAKFVSFGATMTELWVKDKHGVGIDVVPGYDDNVCTVSRAACCIFFFLARCLYAKSADAFVGECLVLGWVGRSDIGDLEIESRC